MKPRKLLVGATKRSVSLVLVSALVALSGVSAAAASSPAKKKHLSMTDVTFNGGYTGDFGIPYIAGAKGFFKQQGLNVTIVDTQQSGAASTTYFLAGSSQFLENGASTVLSAVQQGAPARAIAGNDIGSPEELMINAATATSLGMSLSMAKTGAQAIAQLQHLKGSHLSIGVANIASDGYSYLVNALIAAGVTYQGANSDVTIATYGMVPTMVTGYNSGKILAFANTPPNTSQTSPPSMVIPEYLVPADANAQWAYIVTTTSMINQHPDTVQAFTNAITEAWHYATTHKATAATLLNPMYTYGGYPSADIQKLVFTADYQTWKTTLITKQNFAGQVKIVNRAEAVPVTLTYAQFCVPKFVNKSFQILGYNPAPYKLSS